MEQQGIANKLDKIEKTLEYIQENMVDVDVILSEEEKKMLDESVVREKSGDFVSLEDVENVRNKS